MTVQKLNHVAYRCNDAHETATFYTEVLGLPLRHTIVQDYVPSTRANEPHAHIFFEMADGSWVAFFDIAGEDQVDQEGNPDWAQHLALEVSSLDELEAARLRMVERGIDVLGPVDHGFIQSIYFYDPSGHRLELTCRTLDDADLDRYASEAWDLLDDWSRQKKETAKATTA